MEEGAGREPTPEGLLFLHAPLSFLPVLCHHQWPLRVTSKEEAWVLKVGGADKAQMWMFCPRLLLLSMAWHVGWCLSDS